MRIVVQRSLEAEVLVNSKVVEKIDRGMMLLVGFTKGDNELVIDKMIKKVINLRIFDDENGVMNRSLIDTNGSILSISQFTLYANTKKGNRPSYKEALNAVEASRLYDVFNKKIKEQNINVKTGIFGEDMKVKFTNDGPVTIILESENLVWTKIK